MTEKCKLADAICTAAMDSLMEFEPYTPQVTELCLCEQNQIILKPNVYYRFTVDADCIKCIELEEKGRV